MSEFDDIIEKGGRNTLPEGDRPPTITSNNNKKENPSSILDLLSESGALGSFDDKINPEMKSQVLIPLANLLDKYGYSETITTSPTTNNAINMVVLLNDVIPVIQGLSEYVAGQRNSLDKEDQQFLQEIMDAQESGDFSDLFIDETNLEDVSEEPPSKNIHPILGEMPTIDIGDGKINWLEVLDPDGTVAEENRKKAMGITDLEELELLNLGEKRYLDTPNISLTSLEDLATSAGVSLEDVTSSDSHVIQKENINPPSTIESIDIINEDLVSDMMDSVVFESEPSEESIEVFDDEEMEFVEELNVYRNKETGEIYEVIDEVPLDDVLEENTKSNEGGESFEEE